MILGGQWDVVFEGALFVVVQREAKDLTFGSPVLRVLIEDMSGSGSFSEP